MLDNALDGFNNCLCAYGQTGSGKTFSVLGADDPPESRGLLPRILQELFSRLEHIDTQAEQEQIRDLLLPMNEKPAKLTVRHHPTLGIYVAGLTTNAVSSYQEVQSILDFGTKARSVASTNMNSASSRSHCIFTFNLLKSGGGREQCASVNLVDLAGSERQKKTGTSGSQLKEGAMINQSLSNLALVINKLASFDDEKTDFVPFRNSKLTYILQESLSGNSKTVLIAALSPAFSNLEETLGTLKFAQTCKKATPENSKLQQQLQDTEQLLAQMEQDYQVQLAEAKKLEESRKKALGDLGLDLAEISGAVGMDLNVPQLVNLSDDASLRGLAPMKRDVTCCASGLQFQVKPFSNNVKGGGLLELNLHSKDSTVSLNCIVAGCLVYFLPANVETTIGSDKDCKIVLSGLGIQPFMLVAMRALSPSPPRVVGVWLHRLHFPEGASTPQPLRGDAAELTESEHKRRASLRALLQKAVLGQDCRAAPNDV
eukprot:g9152.t1